MAGSRLERLGTIFSRISGLLRCGALKRDNRPIWYDVYQVFPPKVEPSFGTIRSTVEIRDIFYPEDTIRAKFHYKMRKKMPPENLLNESTADITHYAIERTQNLMRQNELMGEEEAVDKVIETMKREGTISRRYINPKHSKIGLASLLGNTTSSVSQGNERNQDKNFNSQREAKDASDKEFIKRTYVDDFEQAVKNVSNKNVDVTKNLSEEEDK